MKTPHLQRLANLQARLKPTLDSLGLQATFAHYWTPRIIGFFNDDRSVMHSAHISLRNDALEGRDVLAGATLTVWDVGERDIGDNGWKFSYTNDALSIHDLKGGADENLKSIEACLLEQRTVRVGTSHKKVFDDSRVAESFDKLFPLIRTISQEPINFNRIDNVMSFSFFEPSCADTWKFAFEFNERKNCSTVLYVNDQKIGAAPSYELRQVSELVKQTISKFSLDTDRYYPFGPGG